MANQTHRFSITGSSIHIVEVTDEELNAVGGRYHDLVRDKAVTDGLMTKIETRTAYVAPVKSTSTPQG
ncbi:hypothetical protein [Brevundimonas sp. Root1423]|uniref:hypothetical protein n=1 Tax=Brevundimonas sp. Root1423 TaxID=1736462 RepID=UPI0006FD90C5|nr:hypothetical protein [Brevundimonas sp. Root1423]KQY89764.1 hypothetical protein ASD25_04310 [Brevundimonas sp. Root1423]